MKTMKTKGIQTVKIDVKSEQADGFKILLSYLSDVDKFESFFVENEHYIFFIDLLRDCLPSIEKPEILDQRKYKDIYLELCELAVKAEIKIDSPKQFLHFILFLLPKIIQKAEDCTAKEKIILKILIFDKLSKCIQPKKGSKHNHYALAFTSLILIRTELMEVGAWTYELIEQVKNGESTTELINDLGRKVYKTIIKHNIDEEKIASLKIEYINRL